MRSVISISRRLVLGLAVLFLSQVLSQAELAPSRRPARAEEFGARLTVLKSDSQGVVLELVSPSPGSVVVRHNGDSYHSLSIPGLDMIQDPGQPQLPVRGVLLAVPADSSPQVEVISLESEKLAGYHLCPAPHLNLIEQHGEYEVQPSYSPDPITYAADSVFPASVARVGFTGFLRQQRVAQVLIFPIQVNPARGEMLFHRHIQVTVRFGPAVPTSPDTACEAFEEERCDAPDIRETVSPMPDARDPFDHLLRSVLLNYGDTEATSTSGFQDSEQHAAAAPEMAYAFPEDVQTPALKIAVNEEGVYVLNGRDLEAAGFALDAVDPQQLQLTWQGEEIAIQIQGEGDHVLDTDDTITFYGQPATDRFTEDNVYWLQQVEGNGRRWTQRDGQPNGEYELASYFNYTQHEEENHEYWPLLVTPEEDPWYWKLLQAGKTFTHSLDINYLFPSDTTAQVRFRLLGRTDSQVMPDHHTRVSVNGQLLDEGWWDGQVSYERTLDILPEWLQEGANTLVIYNVGDTGSPADSIYLDWLEVIYPRAFVAEGDRLTFAPANVGAMEFEVRGFSVPSVSVLDVTEPANVVQISGTTITPSGESYTVRFRQDGGFVPTYLAFAEAWRQNPVRLVMDTPTDWRSERHGADYIIITHSDFLNAAQRLADFHRGRGLRVAVADIQDIYDEFSYGIFHPPAIRDFLAYAYHHWQAPRPAYVLLLGDASRDYKDYLGLGESNFVPTYLVAAALLGEAPADNWFATVNGDDGLPDLFMGRLPARTLEDAEAMVDKIIAYAEPAMSQDWYDRLLFVADDDEEAFAGTCEDMIAYLPPDYTPQRIYVADYRQPANPRTDILTAINTGVAVIGYVGHGNVDVWGSWAGGRIWGEEDISELGNAERLPFVYIQTCLNGYFAHPTNLYSLGEEFVRVPNKGAIATWSTAGLTYTELGRILSQELFHALYGEGDFVLGSATTAAKIGAYARTTTAWEMVQNFVLLGDPATELRHREWILYLPRVQKGGP